MILKGDFATESEKKRFDAEADAAARMDHPNIVPIYEVGEFEGRAYFCMKLIRVMNQICSAIEYAHQQGVLHRDLKPSNILLDEDNVAYVADFGLAKQASGNQTGLGIVL